jgi:hypothetical protein
VSSESRHIILPIRADVLAPDQFPVAKFDSANLPPNSLKRNNVTSTVDDAERSGNIKMSDANKRSIEDLDKVIGAMQNLHDHPRMQQRNWVTASKSWLPILNRVKEDLVHPTAAHDLLNETFASVIESLERIGLTIDKRDATTWGYRWHGGIVKGAYPSRAQAIEAALRERLR